MRKGLLLLILLFIPFLLTANYQKYYTVQSQEWQSIAWLCRYAGVVGPSSNGPVTGYQLAIAIDRAEKVLGKDSSLVKDARKLLESAKPLVGNKDSGYMILGLDVNLEAYFQTNPAETEMFGEKKGFYDMDWFISNSQDRKALFNIRGELGIKDNAWAHINYNYVPAYYASDIWDQAVFSNIGKKRTESFPFESGISLGNNVFSFIAAKGRASMGEGYTGNTAIGDNFDYQEFIKGGVFSRNVGIYLNITNFDSSHGKENDTPFSFSNPSLSGYQQLRHAASFEVVLFKRVLFSVSLINLLDVKPTMDLRFFNPFYVLHNMFTFLEDTTFESNNMLSGSLSIAVAPKWNVHLQFSLDQSQGKNETDGLGSEELIDPNAFSALLNVTYSDFLGNGEAEFYGELVYNSPCMYLNQKYYKEDGRITAEILESDPAYCWSQDYLVGYLDACHRCSNAGWSGYYWGPDSIVAALGGNYRTERYSVKSQILYMAHGEKGRGVNPLSYTFDGMNTLDTINTMAPSGVVEHTLLLKSEGEIFLTDYFSARLGAAYSYRWNLHNKLGSNHSNLQLMIGGTLKLNIGSFFKD